LARAGWAAVCAAHGVPSDPGDFPHLLAFPALPAEAGGGAATPPAVTVSGGGLELHQAMALMSRTLTALRPLHEAREADDAGEEGGVDGDEGEDFEDEPNGQEVQGGAKPGAAAGGGGGYMRPRPRPPNSAGCVRRRALRAAAK
jgi:hypothetical protein